MVMIFFAATCETGVEQERMGSPSTWTVHAPHRPAPQPNLVPVNSNVSRRTQSRGVSSATSTFRELPLICKVMAVMFEETLGIWTDIVLNQRGKGKWKLPWRCYEFVPGVEPKIR